MENKYCLDIVAGFAERTIRRLWIVIIVLALSLIVSNVAWLIYLYQYDFGVSSVELSTDGGGNTNYIGEDGEIYNGANPGSQKVPQA